VDDAGFVVLSEDFDGVIVGPLVVGIELHRDEFWSEANISGWAALIVQLPGGGIFGR
jgi:hypothetical protein